MATGGNQYSNTPITDFYLDLAVLPTAAEILANRTPVSLVVNPKYQYRMDLLSYDLYGTSNYWWIIALINRNQIQDPIRDLVSGMTIQVLSKSDINGIV
jgi:hypothetical protein